MAIIRCKITNNSANSLKQCVNFPYIVTFDAIILSYFNFFRYLCTILH